jgi:tetratricopeptide (TPR) repeat protein
MNTKIKQQNINTFVQNKQLKQAIDNVKELASAQQNWAISEKISELETNYRYMLHYFVEGQKDPEQKRVYEQFVRDIYTIADDAAEGVLVRNSPAFFFDKMRTLNIRPVMSIDEYKDVISKQIDMISLIDLLEENDPEKENRIKQTMREHEKTVMDLFYTLFVSPRANADFIDSLNAFLNEPLTPIQDKCVLVSALTMNVLQRFDARKIEFLLDVCRHAETEISARAIVGIIPIFQQYSTRWHLYPDCVNRLKILADDTVFSRRLITAIIGFIQAHETEKLTKRLTEEIIPEMMKLSPIIGKKINLDEWMGETGFDEKNPEWQKILDDNGLTDKVQELSELQLEGADVFHSTFSNLKSYPFFHEMSNWFLPFDAQNSHLQQFLADKSEGKTLIKGLADIDIMCNSDKYSFCFSMMIMPEQYRKMMISQMSAEGDELKKMQEEDFVIEPHQKEERKIKSYIQDLYRFFKLFSRRTDFVDIFALPLDYHQISALQPIVSQPHHLEDIALYYFEKNNFNEALSAYTTLVENGSVKSEIWQKIGYCKQMTGDIQGALDAYLHADLMEEKNTWVMSRLAYCYRVLKQPETALEYYRRLEQFRPDDLVIQLNIGHCHLELKQYDEALNYYFKVELLDSHNTRAWRSVAWCAFLSRKFDVARSYYAQIIDKKPNAHDFLNAGHVELCLDNTKKTIEFYRQSLRKAENFDAFRSMLDEDKEVLQDAGVDLEILPIVLDKMRYEEGEL